jgi:hypothetical protein
MKEIMLESVKVMAPVEVVDEDKAMAVEAEAMVMVKDMLVIMHDQCR